jgi:hypothetical protein
LWELENTLEALKQVGKKDIKYIEKDWVNAKWNRRNWDYNASYRTAATATNSAGDAVY